jgi:hypothetical protein
MGDGDANQGGGLDRSSVTKVEVETLMGLLEAARATITKLEGELIALKKRDVSVAPLDDAMLQGTGYRTDLDKENKEMRISMFHGATDSVIAWMIIPVEEVYRMGEKIMSCYDKLENIE